jgi:hypothetical protein
VVGFLPFFAASSRCPWSALTETLSCAPAYGWTHFLLQSQCRHSAAGIQLWDGFECQLNGGVCLQYGSIEGQVSESSLLLMQL